MKINRTKIGLILIAITVVVVAPMHMAHASLFSIADVTLGAVTSFLSYLVAFVFSVDAWLLSLTCALLNVSIDMTMQIKSFVVATPGIYLVWKTLRDLSGMFVIFALLYQAFRIILGFEEKVGTFIKNVVVAGILINFSFFLVGALIDASNLVSLSIYKAIDPSNVTCNAGDPNFIKCQTDKFSDTVHAGEDGGISALIVQSLKVQSIVDPKIVQLDKTKSSTEAASKILMMQLIGIVIMITTALSFLAAAAAFIVRLVILIMLLGFSPVWFVSMIFPDLKSSISDPFWKMLKNQLISCPRKRTMVY